MIPGPSREYRNMVQESIEAESKQYSNICNRICELFDVDTNCFMESIQKHQTENYNKIKWEDTTKTLNEKKELWNKKYIHSNSQEKELTYEETKKIFMRQCKLHRDTYNTLNNMKDSTIKEES